MLLIIVVVYLVSEDCLLLIRVVMAVVILILCDGQVGVWIVVFFIASFAHQIILCAIIPIMVGVFITIVRMVFLTITDIEVKMLLEVAEIGFPALLLVLLFILQIEAGVG